MTVTVEAREDADVEGAGGSILDMIGYQAVHLALWRRGLPTALAWLERLDLDSVKDLDFVAGVDMLGEAIDEGLVEAGYAAGPDRNALCAEIVTLGRRVAEIMQAGTLRIRLEVVETDACRKFHADMVTARLLMTLVGSGTQWVHVDQDDGVVHQLKAGDVGLFKGRLGAEQPAILHRSPPIGGTGEQRLLLVIDPLVRPAPAPVKGPPAA
jgi:hypothetical protein